MPLENGKWRVVRGDCLWNIAANSNVYGNGYKWTVIADANGIDRGTHIIYPGQLLTLPGITPSPTPTPTPPEPAPKPPELTKVTINWFALDSGTDRDMFSVWEFTRAHTDHYLVYWDYDTGQGGWREGSHTENNTNKQSAYSAPANAKKVRLKVKPISETYEQEVQENGKTVTKTYYYWTNGEWVTKEYDFSNNPPGQPPDPDFEIDNNNVLTVTFNNISTDINANKIEVAIYQDDNNKYSTVTIPINSETNFATYTHSVEAGHKYKVRARAVRNKIYGGWTDFTSNEWSCPVTPKNITKLIPQVISEEMSTNYGVYVEWTDEKSAINYEVQWTTNKSYFDISGEVHSQTTEPGTGPKLLVTGIELGHEYFFRVRSINDKGNSVGWTPIKSVILGTRPSAPTTWSDITSAIVGEKINLYWTHNSSDGSYERYARINIKVRDSRNPGAQPMEYTKVVENTKPPEEKDSNSVYVIDTSKSEWSNIRDGCIITWKVQTTGIVNQYSDWSVEREINVYAKPELEIDIKNKNNISIDEVSSFPFYITALATPSTQTPISYYIEIISNDKYDTVDEVGNIKTVNPGDKVYQRYYDPTQNAWNFLIEMTPSNIDLENDKSYTINITVAMNSGLSKTSSKTFTTILSEVFYDVFADVIIDKETLVASIHPYCNEYTNQGGSLVPVLSNNCLLSVYRREYDGTFTEIAKGINNISNTFVTDPHPSLDYARYRIVAKNNDTGSLSYADVPAVYVGEPSVVIQWADKWYSFDYDDSGEGNIEPKWAGSLLKIPYNIDISSSNNKDVALIEYAGRRNPVSYYGTQIGETATWNVEIPAEDKELLYAIRRLSIWTGDVYVREPSGTGFWANISVSYSKQHLSVVIPITFTIKRVEGGM